MSDDKRSPTEQLMVEQLLLAYNHFNRELFDGKLPGCMLTLQRKKRTMGYFTPARFVHKKGGECDEIALNPMYFLVTTVEESLSTLVHEMAHQWQHHFGAPGRRRYHNEEWGSIMEDRGLIPSNTGNPNGRRTGEQMMEYPLPDGMFSQSCSRLLSTGEFDLSWVDRYPDPEAVRRLRHREQTDRIREGSVTTGNPAEEGAEEELAQLELPVIAEPATDGPPLVEDVWYPPGTAAVLLENIRDLGLNAEGNEFVRNSSNRVKYTCPRCDVNVWGKPRLKLICGECDLLFLALAG